MIKKSFAVIGLGRFGSAVALTLAKLGHEVLVIDQVESNVSAIADQVTHAMIANGADERVLDQADIGHFDCVIVTMAGDLQSSILTTLLCKEKGCPQVIAKASNDLHAKLLLKTGADRIIRPELETGVRLAHALVDDHVLDMIELSPEYTISERTLPAGWAGHTLLGLNVRARYQVNIIAVKRSGAVDVVLNADYELKDGDILILIGSNENLQKLGE